MKAKLIKREKTVMIKSWIAPLLIAVCLSPRASALTDDELRGYAIETAENYRLSDGTIRSLKRLAGTIFIQIDNAEAKELVFEEITGAGGVLEGYTPSFGGGWIISH